MKATIILCALGGVVLAGCAGDDILTTMAEASGTLNCAHSNSQYPSCNKAVNSGSEKALGDGYGPGSVSAAPSTPSGGDHGHKGHKGGKEGDGDDHHDKGRGRGEGDNDHGKSHGDHEHDGHHDNGHERGRDSDHHHGEGEHGSK